MRHFFSFIFIGLTACSFAQDSTHFLSQISTEDEYAILKGNPNTSKFGEVDAVKVLYDIQNDQYLLYQFRLLQLPCFFLHGLPRLRQKQLEIQLQQLHHQRQEGLFNGDH